MKTLHEKGGRPRDYDDALILTVACIQNLRQFSLREALEFCADLFPKLPTLSTYRYRLSRISPKIARGFVAFLSKKIEDLPKADAPQKGRVFIMDGMGFSYHDVYPMKLHLGTEIRKIRTHVKIAALMGLAGKKRFVVSAKTGRAYAGETTLIQPQLEALPEGKGSVLGDKGYDSAKIMMTIEIAQTFALLRFALLNMTVLVSLEQAFLWIWFSNSARKNKVDALTYFFTVTNFSTPSPGSAGFFMPSSSRQNASLSNNSMIHGKWASCEIIIPPGGSSG